MRVGRSMRAASVASISPRERARNYAVALPLVLAVIFGTAVFAHRRDEYLQAARVAIEPERVELQLDLTPGVAVAESIIADIDRNGDGSLSRDEKQAYVAQVLSAVSLEIDGRPVLVRPAASTFPDLDAFRRGEGTIALTSDAALPPLSEGAHLLSYRNAYRRDVSVYLANALVPASDRIAIGNLLRDIDQRNLTIDYTLRDARASSLARVWLVAWIAAAALCLTVRVSTWLPAVRRT